MYKKYMKKKTWHSFVKSHNLVNRIYDMLDYFHCFDEVKNVELAKNQIKNMMKRIDSKEYDLLFENNGEITRGHFNRGVL